MNQSKNYSIKQKDMETNDALIESKHVLFLHDLEDDISHMKQLKFQVDCNNFFANLATMIDLTLQDKQAFKSARYCRIYKRIQEDLLYLQRNYNIVPK